MIFFSIYLTYTVHVRLAVEKKKTYVLKIEMKFDRHRFSGVRVLYTDAK